jgi:hypothetical protein
MDAAEPAAQVIKFRNTECSEITIAAKNPAP